MVNRNISHCENVNKNQNDIYLLRLGNKFWWGCRVTAAHNCWRNCKTVWRGKDWQFLTKLSCSWVFIKVKWNMFRKPECKWSSFISNTKNWYQSFLTGVNWYIHCNGLLGVKIMNYLWTYRWISSIMRNGASFITFWKTKWASWSGDGP